MIRMTVGEVTLEAASPEVFLRIAASIPGLASFVRAGSERDCEPWCGLIYLDARVPFVGASSVVGLHGIAGCTPECRAAGVPVRPAGFPR